MPGERYLRLVDFVLWVVAASAAIVVASLSIGLVVGGDLLTGKYLLFVVGFLVFGLGSLLMQPSGPPGNAARGQQSEAGAGQLSSTTSGLRGSSEFGTVGDHVRGLGSLRNQLRREPARQHRFEARLQELGPLADHDLPFEQRIGRGYKLFVTSLLVLAFSLGMELAGIHV